MKIGDSWSDDHVEETGGDARAGGGETRDPWDGGVEDAEVEAWLLAREADIAEQAFAPADQQREEW